MKTFGRMSFKDAQKKMDDNRQEWRDLKCNNPEEYRRRIAAMQSIIDRYNSELGIGYDDE